MKLQTTTVNLQQSQLSSHVVKREWTSVDVGGHCASSDGPIWTLMDLPGRSGNTPKVPGSRPERLTRPTSICKGFRGRSLSEAAK